MIAFRFKKKLQGALGSMMLDVAVELPKNSFTTIYGKSGAGKTTILRILAGLEQVQEGNIVVNEKSWLDSIKKMKLSPQKRSVGIVFQDYGLFPTMTVKQQLHFALEKNQHSGIIDELIAATELGGLQNQKPKFLSGGQRQRVALARALVQQPELLLLDEPLSAIDPEMRQKLRILIKKLHDQYGLTTLMVSHDREEIVQLSDYVIELKNGKILQQGTPSIVFGAPQSGTGFLLKGKVLAIVTHEQHIVLTILIGENILEIINPKKENTALAIGNEVVVSFGGGAPFILNLSST